MSTIVKRGYSPKDQKEFGFEVQVEVIHNVDTVLEKLDHVITSDAIILNKCISWINLNRKIMEEFIGEFPYIDFSGLNNYERR